MAPCWGTLWGVESRRRRKEGRFGGLLGRSARQPRRGWRERRRYQWKLESSSFPILPAGLAAATVLAIRRPVLIRVRLQWDRSQGRQQNLNRLYSQQSDRPQGRQRWVRAWFGRRRRAVERLAKWGPMVDRENPALPGVPMAAPVVLEWRVPGGPMAAPVQMEETMAKVE